MHSFRTLSIMAILVATGCSSSGEGPAGVAGPEGPAGPAAPGAPNAAPGAGASAGTPVIDVASSLALPGNGFYPQSISAAADGALFVGGIGGEVVKFTPDSLRPVPIARDLGVIPGLKVDDTTKSVFICGNTFNAPPAPDGGRTNPFQNPSGTVYQYGFDGKLIKKYPLPAANLGTSICEDLAFDASHNLYISDAFGGLVFRLANGSDAVAKWTGDSLMVGNSTSTPRGVPPFGGHGIAYDGSGNLYVTNFFNSTLIRIPVQPDGSAGKAVLQTVAASPDSAGVVYAQPEGVIALDGKHLVGTIGEWGKTGQLVELTQSAPDAWTFSVLRNNLAGPTSVALSRGNYFVVEGQAHGLVNYLIGATDTPPSPSLPFLVQRQTVE